MELSSGDQDDNGSNQLGGRLPNELDATAFSLNQQFTEIDLMLKEQLSPIIHEFYNKQLVIHKSFKLDDLQNSGSIFNSQTICYSPFPNLYFLPYTILLKTPQNLAQIKQKLRETYPNITHLSPLPQNDEIQLKIHSSSQVVFYKIKNPIAKLEKPHPLPLCLDKDLLVSKFFQYYCIKLKDFYFEEVGGLLMYWAYRKKILGQDYITESAFKLITIAVFINIGVGIPNIIPQYKSIPQNQKKFKEMQKMSTMNKKGECVLYDQLFYETNFSIRIKKGFFMESKQKYMMIKQIYPIYFPLKKGDFQSEEKKNQFQRKVNKIKDKLSLCKNLFRVFKVLSDDFKRNCKVIIDFRENIVFKTQPTQKFSLQVIHPVFFDNLTRQLSNSPTSLRKVRSQVEKAYDVILKSSGAPIHALMEIFSQK